MSAISEMGVNIVESQRFGRRGRRDEPEDEVDPLDDGAPPGRRDQEGSGRPHRRPGAHVPARDGRGGAALPRRRDRHRQAHRGRPRHDDLGPVRKPDHLQRHHRMVERPQRRHDAAARDPRSRGDAVEGPDRRADQRERGRRAKAKARSAPRSPARPSRKRKSPRRRKPPRATTRTWSSGAPSRSRGGGGRGQHPLPRPDGRGAEADGAGEVRRHHLAVQEILQAPARPPRRAGAGEGLRPPTRRSTRSCANSSPPKSRASSSTQPRSNIWSTSSTATTAA